MDVHIFDGKLFPSDIFWSDYEELDELETETKKERLENFKDEISDKLSDSSLQILDILIKDTDTSANYDPTNKLKAGTLLLMIDEVGIKDLTLLDSILPEILGGLCPQGRCTRLYQIYESLIDNSEYSYFKQLKATTEIIHLNKITNESENFIKVIRY